MKVWDKKLNDIDKTRHWWNKADMGWLFFWRHWYDLFVNCKLQITNHKSQIANYNSQITNHKSQITNCKLQITNCNFYITNYKSQITNYKLQISNWHIRDHIFETSWHVSERMCVRGSDWAGQLGLRQLRLGLGMQGFGLQEQLHPKCSSTWQNCPRVSFPEFLTQIMRDFPWGCVRTLGVVGAWEFVEQQAAADRLSGFQVPRCFLGAAQVLSSRSGEQPSSCLPGYQPGSPPWSFIDILDTKLSLGQMLDWV